MTYANDDKSGQAAMDLRDAVRGHDERDDARQDEEKTDHGVSQSAASIGFEAHGECKVRRWPEEDRELV